MNRIKALRTENKLSQRELAEKICSSQKSVDYWEKGVAEPTAKFVIALADSFGCSTDYLLGREDDFGNVNVESDLSADESSLLSIYRNIDADKRAALMYFARFLGELTLPPQ